MYQENDVFLRPLKREDALISYQWRNDAEVWKYTGCRPDRQITPEIEIEWIEGVLQDHTRRTFAICISSTGEYIGNTQITNISAGEGVFHIFIGNRQFWGKGIGGIAAKKMLQIAKNDLKLKRVSLWVNPANSAAVKIYEQNNFVKVSPDGKMELIF